MIEKSLADLMWEEEARLLKQAREEIAAEKAAWDALSPEQQAEDIAKRAANYDFPEQDKDED